MRNLSTLLVVSMVAMIVGDAALAQPRSYNDPGRPQGQYPQSVPQDRGPGQSGQYYYNGRWVDSGEWQRHSDERDQWANRYQRRRGHRDNQDASKSVLAGIIGFALGAAIVGSQQQADRARTADQSFDARCAKKYRTYDRSSRTFKGNDGLRHYCQ